MFPLAGKDFPESAEELSDAIEDALKDVFTLDKGTGVSVEGGKFPAVKKVTIDLDGASVSATKPPPKPEGVGKREDGITVERLEVSGHPIRYEEAELDLGLSARGVTLDFDRDKKGKPLLVLNDAKEGKVEAKISKEDLENLVLEAARVAAGAQGVKIEDLDLKLTSKGPRSAAAEVRVKAKKMMMTGVVVIKGQLDIDDELNATVSGLSASGEGIVGSAAAGIVQGKLRQYDGTKVSLMTFSLGDVKLRDLKIDLKGALKVSASFGSA
jgi:hypothetical protein